MLKRVILLLIALILVSSAYAIDYTFEFQSIETLEPVCGCVAYFNPGTEVYNKYVPEDESITLSLTEEPELIEITVDLMDTQGFDYYNVVYASTLTTEQDQVNLILLNPSSSLRGVVKDSLDNIVSNAKLKFECANLNPTTYVPDTTDEFGSFFIEAMPTGECKIHATSGNSVGSTTVNLEQGDLQDIEIRLDNSVILEDNSNNTLFSLIALLLILIITIGTYVFLKSRKLSKQIQKTTETQQQTTKQTTNLVQKQSKRLDSIIKTLNQKESSIITLLKDRETNTELQSRIRHELGIPRTTLSRLLQSLEKKKIITLSKQGKIVKIKLTDWILEQE
jgi:uncharacterized membrane protein